MNRKIIIRSIILLATLLISAWALLPLEKKLKLGKDLAGGVSLVYTVQIRPGDNASDVINRTITVLKERVDPNGLMEISFAPLGRDRIEISMPLPNDKVKRLRQQFEDELEKLGNLAISDSKIQQFLRMTDAERVTEIELFAGSDQPRKEAMIKLSVAANEAARARTDLTEARTENAAGPEIAELETKLAEADIALEAATAEVRGLGVPAEELRRVLFLSDKETVLRDDRTGQTASLGSPRQQGLERLRGLHPGAIAGMDRVVAAWNAYSAERTTLDDPNDLVRMLQGAGVLSFRITVDPGDHPEEARLRTELRERGPRNVKSTDARWCKINRIENWYKSVQELQSLDANPHGYFAAKGYIVEEFEGQYYMLCWDTRNARLTQADGRWSVASAWEGRDRTGLPAIDFSMDARGAVLLGNLTKDHVGDQMAVLLDDEVYTAPNLNDAISKTGTIYGDFPPEELNYVIRVLSAGSLQAKLSPEPISRSVQAPALGADNLQKGLKSCAISLALITAIIVSYYFGSGFIAVIGMLLNGVLLLALLSMNRTAFSLPGIAGIILSFGMSVDANVLIYERMREELQSGRTLREAVRLGYSRALSAIVDGNLTHLIVCISLGLFGSAEIRGFALSLGLGVLTTLYAQLYVTRLLYDILVEKIGIRKLKMLPMVFPGIQRALHPKVDWMRLRPVFFTVYLVCALAALGLILSRGSKLLDLEFVGGTAVTVQFKKGTDGQPVTLTRAQVQDRVQTAAQTGPSVKDLQSATIVVINARADQVTSDTFTIKTLATDSKAVQAAIKQAFADVLDEQPQVRFVNSNAEAADAPAYPILSPTLGDNIDLPEAHENANDFLGGVAIVLKDLSPPPALSDLRERIKQTTGRADMTTAAGAAREIFVLEGTEREVRSAVVLARDPDTSYFSDQQSWTVNVRDPQWKLIRAALTEPTTYLSGQDISPTIARTFVMQAVKALLLATIFIILYVGVRFNSVQYSAAAMIPTLLDAFFAIGLIAVAQILCENWPGAAKLGLQPFKIDLTMVAAVLTILGYSINDKITILDRIRENRGKLTFAGRDIINASVNQSFSRTIMTGTTTILSTIVLYIVGGEAVRGFAYAMGLGVILGTISSVVIGAPLVWRKRLEKPVAAPAALVTA